MAERPVELSISRNTSPPLEDFEKLTHAFATVDEVGPPFTTGKQLQKVEDELFDGLRRRTVAGAQPLNWLKGSLRLQEGVLTKIPVGGVSAWDVFAGFKQINANRLRLEYTESHAVRLSTDKLIQRELVHVGSTRHSEYVTRKPSLHHYARLSSEWARFFVELDAVDDTAADVSLRCLREGRVICVTDDGSGPALLARSHWHAKSGFGGHSRAYFLLTSDLPEAWHTANMGSQEKADRREKAAAMRWLAERYRCLELSGQRLTKDDVVGVLRSDFGMTSHKVMAEIWSEPRYQIGEKQVALKCAA